MRHRSARAGRALSAVVASALLVGACGEQGAEETKTPPPPPPPAPGLQQPTDGETGLPDAGDIARDAEAAGRQAADEIREAVEGAGDEAKQQAEQARAGAEQQVEEVSQAARETIEKYTQDLGSLGDLLAGVTSQFDAATAAPKAQTLIESLRESMTRFEQMAPEQFARLKSMYGETLAPLVTKVETEINRLTSSDSFAALRPILQDIPLLKP